MLSARSVRLAEVFAGVVLFSAIGLATACSSRRPSAASRGGKGFRA